MVDEGAPLQGDILGGADAGHRGVFQAGAGQKGHVIGGRVVLLLVEAAGIGKMGVAHAKLPGLLIHKPGKALQVLPNPAGNDLGGIVARLEQQPVEQGLQGQLVPRLEIEGRALHPLQPFRFHGDDLGQVGGLLHRHQGGHQFGDTGNGAGGVHVLFKEHTPGPRIHKHRRRGGGGHRSRRGGGTKQ